MVGSRTVRIDPHVHSAASYDGRDPPELLLEQAAAVGLDAVVVTDHDRIEASLRAADLAPEFGLIGIPGAEISTAHGHLLGIGIEELPDPGRPMDETVATVRDLGGVAVVPHPFQRTRHGARRRVLQSIDIDGIETYNAWLFTGYRNLRARAFAHRNGLTSLAGSDAHSVTTVGRAFTEMEFEDRRGRVTARDVVEAIHNGTTAVHGRRAPIHRCAGHYAKGAGRKAAWAARAAAMALV
ncbi:PHP domain-containing protein [Salinirubellus sp. GCM10025818]|jgi:predicted metal-dependent phosphoesterase TrpH|uniref:PHP domain-containing protein n=1 Tax=Salinirubellus TaxID=2162630 RepID=UPI0030D16EED